MNNREKILDLLQKSSEEWLSGEYISNILGISRTAVWKNINTLKDTGYQIESSSKLGHKLISSKNVLSTAELEKILTTDTLGREIVFFNETDSTNVQAFSIATKGASHGTVVISESQSMGKGRLQRKWYTDPGKGLAVSMILRPVIEPIYAPRLTLVTAVALSEVLDEIGLNTYEIKWPNDILIKGKKAAGILSEMKADIDRVDFVIIGFGININTVTDLLPHEIKDIACSLMEELGFEISRTEFLATFLKKFEESYNEFLSGNFAGILEKWIEKSKILNKKIKVTILDRELYGTVRSVNDDGNLILETGEGLKTINSGDINYI